MRRLGAARVDAAATGADTAPFSYRELAGPPASLRYLLSASDGRTLRRELLRGAGRRLGAPIAHLRDLPDDYMATGQVFFRGLAYDDLHRLQFDLETTARSPREGRIFLVAVRDGRGLESVLEAPIEGAEAALIADLCALVRVRAPPPRATAPHLSGICREKGGRARPHPAAAAPAGRGAAPLAKGDGWGTRRVTAGTPAAP